MVSILVSSIRLSFGQSHAGGLTPEQQDQVGLAQHQAAVAAQQSDFRSAAKYCEQAASVLREALGPNHWSTQDQARAQEFYLRLASWGPDKVGAYKTLLQELRRPGQLWADDKHAEAINEQNQIANRWAALFGTDDAGYVSFTARVAWYQGQDGDTGAQIETLQRAMVLACRLLGPEHPHYTEIVGQLAEAYWKAGQSEQGRQLLCDVAEASCSRGGACCLQYGRDLLVLARFEARRQPHNAPPLFTSAVDILRSHVPESAPDLLRGLLDQAVFLVAHDAAIEAEQAARAAVSIASEYFDFGPNRSAYIDALEAHSKALEAIRVFSEAAARRLEIINVLSATESNTEPSRIAYALTMYANDLDFAGRSGDADMALQKATDLCSRIRSPDDYFGNIAVLNLIFSPNWAQRMGDQDRACQRANAVVAFVRTRPEPRRSTELELALSEQALLLEQSGEYRRAIAILNELVEVRQQLKRPQSDQIDALVRVGRCLFADQRLVEAEQSLRRAYDTCQSDATIPHQSPVDTRTDALASTGLANFLIEVGRADEAEQILEASLARIGDKNSDSVCDLLRVREMICMRRGDVRQVIEIRHQLKRLAPRDSPPGDDQMWEAFANGDDDEAQQLWSRQSHASETSTADRSDASALFMQAIAAPTKRGEIQYLRRALAVWQPTALVPKSQIQTRLGQRLMDDRDSLDEAEQLLMLAMDDFESRFAALPGDEITRARYLARLLAYGAPHRALAKLKLLRAALISNEKMQPPSSQSTLFTLNAQGEQYEREAFALICRLRGLLAHPSAASSNPSTDLSKEIALQLRPLELMLVYDIGEESAFVFAVDKSGGIVADVLTWASPATSGPVTTATLAEAVEQAYIQASGEPLPKQDDSTRSKLTLRKLGARHSGYSPKDLFAALIPPWLIPILGTADGVVLITDGPLNNLSFTGLAIDADGKRWIDRLPPVSYATSVGDFLNARGRPQTLGGDAVPRQIVLFGDPAFANATETRPGGITLTPLPNTMYEVQHIRDIFLASGVASGSIIMRTGPNATLAEFGAVVSNPRVLHLATHGFGLGGSRILESGVALAKSDYLTLGALKGALAKNISGIDLVVLSACQTGVAENLEGSGMFSLGRGFLDCGAGAVVSSMWRAPDAPTLLLMTRFYQNWLGVTAEGQRVEPMDKRRALYSAQRWLRTLTRAEADAELTKVRGIVNIQTARNSISLPALSREESGELEDRPYSHPNYWAEFVLLSPE